MSVYKYVEPVGESSTDDCPGDEGVAPHLTSPVPSPRTPARVHVLPLHGGTPTEFVVFLV